MIFISITIHLVRHSVLLNDYVVKTFSHLATRPGHNHLLSSSGDCGDGGYEIDGDAGGAGGNDGVGGDEDTGGEINLLFPVAVMRVMVEMVVLVEKRLVEMQVVRVSMLVT